MNSSIRIPNTQYFQQTNNLYTSYYEIIYKKNESTKYFQIFNIKMEIFEQLLQERSFDHDKKVHVQQTHTREVSKDPSCVLCNMVRTKPRIDFWNFWNWYRKVTGAETYTENTIKVFYKKEIKTDWENMEEVTTKAISLIETMRYHPKNGIEIKTQDLVRRLTLVIIQSDWFKGKIEEENEEMSELSDCIITK